MHRVKHFEITEWLDFLHGFAGEAERAAMQRHLDTGCNQCGSTVGMLRKLIATATSDAQYQVPEHALHMARAIYALQRPEQVQVLPRVLARLVFDSFREPALAGVRSQERLARQAMYQAGDYCVDLRIEQQRGVPGVVLVGQIANSTNPEQKLADVPVILMGGDQVLSRTQSNRFGEFQMEYKPRHPLRLYVPVQLAGQEIEVQLQDLFDHGPTDPA